MREDIGGEGGRVVERDDFGDLLGFVEGKVAGGEGVVDL